MKNKLCVFLSWMMTFFFFGTANAEPRLRVVATLSVFADLTNKIGGEFVEVHTVASPRFNPHFIEPRPSDVLRMSKADLLVHGGLDLEAWRSPLVEAASNRKVMPGGAGELDLSGGITLLEVPTAPVSRAQGDIHMFGNPHYWMDPRNGKIMAEAIGAKLREVDPAHQKQYEANLAAFLSKLDEKLQQWATQVAPAKGKEALAYHKEWNYLCDFTGIKIAQFLEPKPGIPPTPRHLAFLEEYIRNHKIPVIFQASYYSKDAAHALEKRTGIKMALLCQNVGEIPEASDFFSFFDYNIATVSDALKEDKS